MRLWSRNGSCCERSNVEPARKPATARPAFRRFKLFAQTCFVTRTIPPTRSSKEGYHYLCQNSLDHFTPGVGEALIPAGAVIGELHIVQAHQVHHRRVYIAHAVYVFHRLEAQI